MHAALSIPVTGAWRYEGGGAFHSNSGVLLDTSRSRARGCATRRSAIRPFAHRPGVMGHDDALHGGPPVTAMLIQNTNPVNVALSSGW